MYSGAFIKAGGKALIHIFAATGYRQYAGMKSLEPKAIPFHHQSGSSKQSVKFRLTFLYPGFGPVNLSRSSRICPFRLKDHEEERCRNKMYILLQ